MNWFADQLKERRKKDSENFDESLKNMSGALMGKALTSIYTKEDIAKNSIEAVIKFFKIKTKKIVIPNNEETFEGQLHYSCSQYGIMYREVELDSGWYKSAIGPIIATKIDDGTKVAILPDIMGFYHYFDLKSQRKVRITKKTEALFEKNAFLFYEPLPLKKLNVKDLLIYMLHQINGMDIALYFFMLACTTALGFLSPMFTKWLFGDVINTAGVDMSKGIYMLIGLAAFMVCYSICQLMLSAFNNICNSRINTKTEIAVQAAVMARVMNLPAKFFKNYSSGELSSRAAYVQSLCSLLYTTILSTGITSLFSLVYIAQIFQFAASLVVPSLIITVATVVISLITTFASMRISKRRMELNTKTAGVTYSTITGIQKIKLAGAEKRMFARWANAYAQEAQLEYNPPTFLKISGTINLAITLFGTLALYYIAVKTQVTVANYYAFTASYGMISGAFMSVASITTSIANIKPTLDMARPIMETEPEVSEGKKMVTRLSGSIEISNVSFRYDSNMPFVLNNLSLKINRGEYVAIVGSTGCGKSTLVRLLLGFETPYSGSIYYDQYDMKTIDLKSLRKNIGTVMQDSQLFSGDIYSNIAIAAPKLTLDEAWEIAKLAAIDEDIQAMPMGMNTLISEGQGGVSGGQKQRLIIARALASKPKVLIFDEATSALDNITQKKISEAVDGLKCTRIVIAHRLSTIKNADRIIYLEGGKVVEEGKYDELIAQNGKFAELVARQRLDTDESKK